MRGETTLIYVPDVYLLDCAQTCTVTECMRTHGSNAYNPDKQAGVWNLVVVVRLTLSVS